MRYEIGREYTVTEPPPAKSMARVTPIRFVVSEAGCWNCVGRGPNSAIGYYTVKRDGRKSLLHRYVYQLMRGPIPSGMDLLHSCDNSHCINPDHLRPGTHYENMQDRAARFRGTCGERSRSAKLTEAQVREILSDKTSRHETLSERYGVCPRQIYMVRARKSWKHLQI